MYGCFFKFQLLQLQRAFNLLVSRRAGDNCALPNSRLAAPSFEEGFKNAHLRGGGLVSFSKRDAHLRLACLSRPLIQIDPEPGSVKPVLLPRQSIVSSTSRAGFPRFQTVRKKGGTTITWGGAAARAVSGAPAEIVCFLVIIRLRVAMPSLESPCGADLIIAL